MTRRCKDCPEGTRRSAPHPGPRCATHHRERRAATRDSRWERHLREVYGISAQEYWALYEAQGRACYGCARAYGKSKKLCVDHDHATGKIRGLLCNHCNRDVVGFFRDDPAPLLRLASYIVSPPAFAVLGERIVPAGPGKIVRGRR